MRHGVLLSLIMSSEGEASYDAAYNLLMTASQLRGVCILVCFRCVWGLLSGCV